LHEESNHILLFRFCLSASSQRWADGPKRGLTDAAMFTASGWRARKEVRKLGAQIKQT
jgi:hypothetical protein